MRSFSRALFYPTMDIQNEAWLKTAILFWDEISTIVPESVVNPYVGVTTQYLEDEGILCRLPINPDQRIVKALTKDVLNYLDTNEGFQLITQGQGNSTYIHRDKLPSEINTLFNSRIHPSKFSYALQEQFKRHLTEDGWLRTDSSFALFYMTLLANKICEENSLALLSDNPLTSNLTEKVRLDNQIRLRGGRSMSMSMHNPLDGHPEEYKWLAQGLLVNLIIEGIRVHPETSIEDIVNYKKRNSDELGLFRANIAKLTKDISTAESFESVKQQIEDVYRNEFLPSYNGFKKSLKGNRIKWFTDNFLKINLVSTSLSSIPVALGGLSIPHALLASAGISLIASAVSYNEDKRDKLRNNPYSYLLTSPI